MTTTWRITWREPQDTAPPVTRGEWRDDEGEALRLAEEVARRGLVVGEVLIYEVTVNEGERVA